MESRSVICRENYKINYFLFYFIGSDKIICTIRALPILFSDVHSHYFKDHYSYLLSVWLLMLYTKDTLNSIIHGILGSLQGPHAGNKV
jgi:hypothetical protein